MPDDAPASTVAPLAVDAVHLAAMLDVSLSHIRRMDSAGKLPRPQRLGNSVRWAVDEIREWLRAGTPDRVTWERQRGGVR